MEKWYRNVTLFCKEEELISSPKLLLYDIHMKIFKHDNHLKTCKLGVHDSHLTR